MSHMPLATISPVLSVAWVDNEVREAISDPDRSSWVPPRGRIEAKNTAFLVQSVRKSRRPKELSVENPPIPLMDMIHCFRSVFSSISPVGMKNLVYALRQQTQSFLINMKGTIVSLISIELEGFPVDMDTRHPYFMRCRMRKFSLSSLMQPPFGPSVPFSKDNEGTRKLALGLRFLPVLARCFVASFARLTPRGDPCAETCEKN